MARRLFSANQSAERAVLRKVETEILKLRDELEARGIDEVGFRCFLGVFFRPDSAIFLWSFRCFLLLLVEEVVLVVMVMVVRACTGDGYGGSGGCTRSGHRSVDHYIAAVFIAAISIIHNDCDGIATIVIVVIVILRGDRNKQDPRYTQKPILRTSIIRFFC